MTYTRYVTVARPITWRERHIHWGMLQRTLSPSLSLSSRLVSSRGRNGKGDRLFGGPLRRRQTESAIH